MRHGQSSYNTERRIQGRCDKSVLTEKGRADAILVGNLLRGLTFDAIYTSPLQRAYQTAETIRSCFDNAPELHAPNSLMEIDLPLWEELLKQDVKSKFPDDYQCWKERPQDFCMVLPATAGETREHFPVLSLYEQAQSFWQEVLPRHRGQTLLVVAHNGINRCLIATATGIPPSHYHSIQQSNCGISVLNFAGELGDSVQLESMNLTTHMGELFPKPREEHQGFRLLLVRHGETDWNRQKRFQGWNDVPLNDNGRAQAQKAADFLQSVPLDFAVSSPMLRPKETAEIILKPHANVPLHLEEELREISHGLWEGKLEAEIEAAFPGELQQWQTKPETVQMPEGENLQQVWERAISAWSTILNLATPGSIGLVVAHDAINKAILCHLFGLDPEHFWKFKQGNGSVTVIDYPKGLNGLPVLQAMNITTHLNAGILDQTAAGAL